MMVILCRNTAINLIIMSGFGLQNYTSILASVKSLMSSHTRHARGGFNLENWKKKKKKSESSYLSNAHPIPKEHCFWRVPRFRCFSFWWEKHVEEDECGAWVEWYWQGRTKVLGEKPVPVPLCQLQMSCGRGLGSNQGHCGERPVTDHLSHGMAF